MVQKVDTDSKIGETLLGSLPNSNLTTGLHGNKKRILKSGSGDEHSEENLLNEDLSKEMEQMVERDIPLELLLKNTEKGSEHLAVSYNAFLLERSEGTYQIQFPNKKLFCQKANAHLSSPEE